jgi:hypothetical protein
VACNCIKQGRIDVGVVLSSAKFSSVFSPNGRLTFSLSIPFISEAAYIYLTVRRIEYVLLFVQATAMIATLLFLFTVDGF